MPCHQLRRKKPAAAQSLWGNLVRHDSSRQIEHFEALLERLLRHVQLFIGQQILPDPAQARIKPVDLLPEVAPYSVV